MASTHRQAPNKSEAEQEKELTDENATADTKRRRRSHSFQDTTWTWEDDLLYALPGADRKKVCASRLPEDGTPGAAGGHGKAVRGLREMSNGAYCSRECQIQDWKKGGRHKRMCPQLIAFKNFDRDQKRQW